MKSEGERVIDRCSPSQLRQGAGSVCVVGRRSEVIILLILTNMLVVC